MSVKQTPGGTYQVRWRDGAHRQRSQTFKRKIDAENFAKTLDADRVRGILGTTDGRITVSDWADRWLDGARNLGQGGKDTYRRDLDRHIIPTLGDIQLDRLTADTIDQLLTDKLDAGYAASTVVRIYRTIHRMCAVAVDRHRLARNPCATVHPPPLEHTEMRFLDVAQVDALAAAIAPRYETWVHTAAYGGIRWSEGVGLRRSNVDGKRLAIVDQLLVRADGKWHRDKPKTRAGRRVVTLPVFVADLLVAHLGEWSMPGPSGLVFPNRVGRPMRNSNFSQAVFKPALKRAGIDPLIRVHDLRHTAVALAIKAGAHPKAIQVRMGHASIGVTLDRYGHLFPEMDDQIADALGDLHAAAGRCHTPSVRSEDRAEE